MTARNLEIIHINLSLYHHYSVIWVSLEGVCLGFPQQCFLPSTLLPRPPPGGTAPPKVDS